MTMASVLVCRSFNDLFGRDDDGFSFISDLVLTGMLWELKVGGELMGVKVVSDGNGTCGSRW